jgi:hypothetical protein
VELGSTGKTGTNPGCFILTCSQKGVVIHSAGVLSSVGLFIDGWFLVEILGNLKP